MRSGSLEFSSRILQCGGQCADNDSRQGETSPAPTETKIMEHIKNQASAHIKLLSAAPFVAALVYGIFRLHVLVQNMIGA